MLGHVLYRPVLLVLGWREEVYTNSRGHSGRCCSRLTLDPPLNAMNTFISSIKNQ